MHRLLERQLRRAFGGADTAPPSLRAFLADVDQAYQRADVDRSMIERSLELASEELLARNHELQRSLGNADARVRFGEQRLQSLMGTLAEGIVVYDSSRNIVDLNDEAASYLGVSRDEALRTQRVVALVDRLLYEDGQEADLEQLPTATAIRIGRPVRNKVVGFRRRDGSEIYVRANAAPEVVDGAVRHVITSYTDVTAQRAIERMKTEFVALASHELRTPLTGILGFAHLLAIREDIPGEAADWAALIEAEAWRLAKVAGDLLDVARLDGGGLRMQCEVVAVRPIIEAVVAQLYGGTATHSFVLEGGGEVVRADGVRLAQVLFNLLENAVKYSPAGGPVEVRWMPSPRGVSISVTDCGVGIAAAELPNLFRRFYRVDSEEHRDIRGTGMGLYLVREFVTAMGGDVRVRSELGRGSTFTVDLRDASSQEALAS